MCTREDQDLAAGTLMGVILIDRQPGATSPMTRSGGPRAGDDRSDARPGDVWAEATSGFNRWVAGEAGGLDDLVAVMTPVLWHVVRAYRLPDTAAEDVIQNTWLALVRRRAAIVDPVAVGGWLTTTARREAWRAAERQRPRPRRSRTTTSRRCFPGSARRRTSVVQHDEGDRLWAAVDGLPERCRRLLRIVAFENRPDYAQLATELGMPVGSIGPTRGRCLAKLRVALMQAGGI